MGSAGEKSPRETEPFVPPESPVKVRPGGRWTISHGPRLSLAAGLLGVVLLGYFSSKINGYYSNVLTKLGINVILAVSLNLVNGYTGQFSLGHAGFMGVGAYTSAAITMFVGPKVLPPDGSAHYDWATYALFGVALLIGGLVAALAGLIVGAPSLRLKGDYLAIVTLGFGEIIRVIFSNIKSLGGGLGLNGIPSYTTLFWIFAAAILCIYIVVAMVHSTYGRGFIAVQDDEVAAEAMGLNTTRYKIVAFVVGAFFAGIAGGLYGHDALSIDPKGFGFMRSIDIVVMVILGGMGFTPGVIAAAIVLTLLPEWLRPVDEYRMVIYSFLLVLLMLVRPKGLFTWLHQPKTPRAYPLYAGRIAAALGTMYALSSNGDMKFLPASLRTVEFGVVGFAFGYGAGWSFARLSRGRTGPPEATLGQA